MGRVRPAEFEYILKLDARGVKPAVHGIVKTRIDFEFGRSGNFNVWRGVACCEVDPYLLGNEPSEIPNGQAGNDLADGAEVELEWRLRGVHPRRRKFPRFEVKNRRGDGKHERASEAWQNIGVRREDALPNIVELQSHQRWPTAASRNSAGDVKNTLSHECKKRDCFKGRSRQRSNRRRRSLTLARVMRDAPPVWTSIGASRHTGSVHVPGPLRRAAIQPAANTSTMAEVATTLLATMINGVKSIFLSLLFVAKGTDRLGTGDPGGMCSHGQNGDSESKAASQHERHRRERDAVVEAV